ncbi:MAG: hypothetical protein RL338_1524 [Chloroflexota bacterium]
MTTAPRPVPARLARLHLRTGALPLARAELETLAGHELLDAEALADLAEVRWRTGDLAGAGEAARAYLETGRETQLALAIAAEAAEALGRPVEARRHVARLVERLDAEGQGPEGLDGLFAGQPRSGIWPSPAGDHGVQGPLFSPEVGVFERVARAHPGLVVPGPDPDLASVRAGLAAEAAAGVAPVEDGSTGAGDGLWSTLAEPPVEPDLPDPREALAAGRAALAAGRGDEAAVELGIALRLDPGTAPAILEAIDAVGRVATGEALPALELLRGDALLVVGRPAEARAAWSRTARPGPGPSDTLSGERPDPEVTQ